MADRQPRRCRGYRARSFSTSVSAFENLRSEDGKAWLLAIVRNTSLTWMKRNRATTSMIGLGQQLEDPSEPSPDPEETLMISVGREEVGEKGA
jgi:DNA-directed RNA polymerase specialized sigma24 family protein